MAAVTRSTDSSATPSAADVSRRAGLRRMKTVATSLLVGAAVIYVVARVNEDSATWIGYVRAIAEAAMVGALADWFAVTALFRHPLGLPIPHTAIIPTRKEQIGRSLGEFVESNFLTADVIDERLRTADVGRRAGVWLADPVHTERVGDALADVVRGALEVLDDDEIQAGLEHLVESRVRATPLTPVVGTAIDVAVQGGHHQRLLDATLIGLAGFLGDNRVTFRERMYEESPWWVPESVDDRVFNKIYDVVTRFLNDVVHDPRHPLRASVDTRVATFAQRLRTDPVLLANGEALKDELLDHPEVRAWIDSLWREAKGAMISATHDRDSELRRRIVRSLQRLGERLTTDEELQYKLDAWIAGALGYLVDNYRTEVGDIISSTVNRWDGAATADKLELQVGRDLQFIRINGTIVGGLAGLVIHAVGQAL